MKRGDSILIHAGTGGVGQAAIILALHYELEVFVTVGTAEKREFIKTNFPQVKNKNNLSLLNNKKKMLSRYQKVILEIQEIHHLNK